VFRLYTLQFRVHAVVEAVFAVVECVLCATWLAACFVAQWLAAAVLQHRTPWAQSLRECVIYAAAALSFAVPCLTNCTVYGGFNAEADGWHLRPLVTVVGAVDPRRFRSVMRGNGAWAVEGGGDDPARKHALDLPPETVLYTMDNLCGPFGALCGSRYARGYSSVSSAAAPGGPVAQAAAAAGRAGTPDSFLEKLEA
jgi:hypothetical protein